MIYFGYFCTKIFLFRVWPKVILFVGKLDPKIAIIRGFTKMFSELLDYS